MRESLINISSAVNGRCKRYTCANTAERRGPHRPSPQRRGLFSDGSDTHATHLCLGSLRNVGLSRRACYCDLHTRRGQMIVTCVYISTLLAHSEK